MLQLRWLGFSLAVLVTAMFAGCGEKPAPTPKEVKTARFRSFPRSAVGTPEGLVLTKEGSELRAELYRLKDGPGFDIDERIGIGKYHSDRKAFILMLADPRIMLAQEEILAQGGPYFEIPLPQPGSNLVSVFVSPGVPRITTDLVPFVP
jgi:hypothetical protein